MKFFYLKSHGSSKAKCLVLQLGATELVDLEIWKFENFGNLEIGSHAKYAFLREHCADLRILA